MQPIRIPLLYSLPKFMKSLEQYYISSCNSQSACSAQVSQKQSTANHLLLYDNLKLLHSDLSSYVSLFVVMVKTIFRTAAKI